MKLSSATKRIISFLENQPLNFPLWAAAFLSLIAARLFVENWLGNFQYRDTQFLFSEFAHTSLFFLFSYILFLVLLRHAAQVSIPQAANILLWGFLIILTPPIIDWWISGGAGFWSFYEFDSLEGLLVRFITFFGEDPTMGITYGVRVEVAFSLILFFVYILLKTNLWKRALGYTFLGYALFFVLGTFPSWVTIAVLGAKDGFLNITSTDIAGLFLSPETTFSYTPGAIINALNAKASILYALLISALIPGLSYVFFRKTTLAILGNARWPQVVYHGGLVCVGAGLALVFSPETITHLTFWNALSFLLLIVAAVLAWLASVVSNDFFDRDIDRISNAGRPLISKILPEIHYRWLGFTLFFASVFFAAVAHPFAALFIVFYHAITFAYNTPPFRLKRFPIIATLIGALASLAILFAGYVFADKTRSLEHLPWQIPALLAFAYTVSLPLKDFKDIKGDRQANVWTLPVILGESTARILVASGIFLSFLLSTVAFNISAAFPWAFFLGAGAFWIVASPNIRIRQKTLPPNLLPHAVLALVFLYGLILTGYLF